MKRNKILSILASSAMAISLLAMPIIVGAKSNVVKTTAPDNVAQLAENNEESVFEFGISYDGKTYDQRQFEVEYDMFSQENIKVDFTKDYLYIKVVKAIAKEYSGEIKNIDNAKVMCSFQNVKGAFGVENNNGVFKIPTVLLNQKMGDYDKVVLELPDVAHAGYCVAKIVVDSSNVTSPKIHEVDLRDKEYIDESGNIISIDKEGKHKFTNEEATDNPYTVEYAVDKNGNYRVSNIGLDTYICNMMFTYDEKADCLTYNRSFQADKLPSYISKGAKFIRYKDKAYIGDKGYKTLQSAYADAKAGDTIQLDEGVFIEELDINKDITLQGKGSDKTIIKGKVTLSNSQSIFNDLKIENNADTEYGTALITFPINQLKASATFNDCIINDNDTAFRVESAGSSLILNNTNVTGLAHYGIGLRNCNQILSINGGTITGWAGIMTSGGKVPTANANTQIMIKNATIIGDSMTHEENYGSIVLQEDFHGVNLTIEDSSIIAKGKMTSALDIRAYGSVINVKNSKLVANDLVYGLDAKPGSNHSCYGVVAISENELETIYSSTNKVSTKLTLTDSSIQCKQVKKNGNLYEGTYPLTISRTGDTVTINGQSMADLTHLTLSENVKALEINDTYNLQIDYNPAYFCEDTRWSSSDKNIATVDENGKVTAVSAGTATITASAGDKSATCTVTVYKVETPVIPPVDTTKPVEDVTTGITDKESEQTLTDTTNDIVDKIVSGKDVKNVSEETAKAVKEAVEAGKTVTTEVQVNNLSSEKVSKDEKQDVLDLLTKQAEKNKTTTGIAQFLDLSVMLKADGKELGTVNELNDAVSFTVVLPKDFAKTGRSFYVMRIHDGKTEILPTTMNDDGTLTFKTDVFSTYALVYEDKGTETPVTPPSTTVTPPTTPTKGDTVKTSDKSMMEIYVAICGMAMLGFGIVVLIKKKEELSNR